MQWVDLLSGAAPGLFLAPWQQWLRDNWVEALGFVTGAVCVALVVRRNIWNFPVGIANNIFFLVLFFNARIYGDAALQVVYLALGAQGWYHWAYGGQNRTALPVTHASWRLLGAATGFVVVGTAVLTGALQAARGSAPVLDALTTVLSLAAQYLLNRKTIENWYFWITADVLYVYLYVTRGLYLTAVLYAGFLCLCVVGLVSWRRALRQTRPPGPGPGVGRVPAPTTST